MTPDCPVGCTLHEVAQLLGERAPAFVVMMRPVVRCDGQHRTLAGTVIKRARCGPEGHGAIYPRGWVEQWASGSGFPKEPWEG